jgi:hypothetical protein
MMEQALGTIEKRLKGVIEISDHLSRSGVHTYQHRRVANHISWK